MNRIAAYSDGASRGNPGRASIGIVLLGENNRVLREHSRYIGIATNNQAEYKALIKALEMARDYSPREVACYLDSELLVKQLNGEYKTRASELRKLQRLLREREKAFKKVTYSHVRRNHPYVERADKLANSALDSL